MVTRTGLLSVYMRYIELIFDYGYSAYISVERLPRIPGDGKSIILSANIIGSAPWRVSKELFVFSASDNHTRSLQCTNNNCRFYFDVTVSERQLRFLSL